MTCIYTKKGKIMDILVTQTNNMITTLFSTGRGFILADELSVLVTPSFVDYRGFSTITRQAEALELFNLVNRNY